MSAHGQNSSSAAGIPATFASIPYAVRQFWNAVAWPLFGLSVTIVTLAYVLIASEHIPSADSIGLLVPSQDGDTDKAFKLYGLYAIIPIAVLILLLGIAQANSVLMSSIGKVLPIRIARNDVSLLVTNAKIGDLVRVWEMNPDITNIEGLSQFLDVEAERSETGDRDRAIMRNARYDLEAISRFLAIGEFIRGILAVAVLAWFAQNVVVWQETHHWTSPNKLIYVVGLDLFLLAWLTLNYIQLVRQYTGHKVSQYLQYTEISGRSKTIAPWSPSQYQEKMKELDSLAKREKHQEFSIWFGYGVNTRTNLGALLSAWGRYGAHRISERRY